MAGWEKWASRFHVMKQQRTKRDEAVRAATNHSITNHGLARQQITESLFQLGKDP